MGKISSRLEKIQNKHYFAAFSVFHALVVLVFLISFFVNPKRIGIDANLMNMLPASFEQKAVGKADELLTDGRANHVYILVTNPDFSVAREVAVQVYDELNEKFPSKFKSISLYSELSATDDILDFIYKYRWNLLDDKTATDILNGGAEAFAENSLMQIYSGWNVSGLDRIEDDPFMLTEYGINRFLQSVQQSGTAMSLKDGVLASFVNDLWYVMISAELSEEGAQLASKENGIAKIYSVCEPLEKDGVRFVYQGTPYHSYKNSSEASTEITTISSISMIAVIIILFFVFKSPIPIVASIGTILISILTAFLSCLVIFGNVHILTLVFGTSLIGSCIDYSLHFFINWKANAKLNSGKQIRSSMLRGLSLSLISTVLCFGILLFAPYTLLKQMATFSIFGLVSSYMTVICIYPFIPLPKESSRSLRLMRFLKIPDWYNRKLVGRIAVTTLFLIPIVLFAIFHKNVGIENDLNKLYSMEGRQLADEIEAGEILQYNPSGWFIIRGDTEADVLSKEENLADTIKTYSKQNQQNASYLASTLFVPSLAAQKKSKAASEKLLALAESQYEAIGLESDDAADLRAMFAESKDDFISFEKNTVPDFFSDLISDVWLGKIDESYYSVLVPSVTMDLNVFREFADESNDIFYVSKIEDTNVDLDKLTKMILILFGSAYIVIFVILKFFYSTKQSFKIISIPLLILLTVAAVFAAANIKLEFFSITGIILVFGLGLDYIIYMMENEKNPKNSDDSVLEPFAILLSFITTIISFGALSLSNFAPVHLIGLSIFIGLIVAYFSSVFYSRNSPELDSEK